MTITEEKSGINLKVEIVFKEVLPTYPGLLNIITPSIGNPTPEKIQQVLTAYNKVDHHLMGSFIENKLIGVIGIIIKDDCGTIRHIAVCHDHRKKGIGKILIRNTLGHFLLKRLIAETDNEAVDFYKNCGFHCREFISQYGKRYECILSKQLDNTNGHAE